MDRCMRVQPLPIKYLATRRRTLSLSISYITKKIILVAGLEGLVAIPRRETMRLSRVARGSSPSMWRLGFGEFCSPDRASLRSASMGEIGERGLRITNLRCLMGVYKATQELCD